MPPLSLLLSFFPNSSLARRCLAAHTTKRSRKRRELGDAAARAPHQFAAVRRRCGAALPGCSSEASRQHCARAPHQAAAARQEAHTEMKEEKMESRPGRGVRRRRSHRPQCCNLAGGGGHGGEAALSSGAACLLCRSFFLSSPTPLLHIVVLPPMQQIDRGRGESWVNQSVA
ncbi:hypothetical protein VPH35_088823 [Triticum aestivum]